ncbi:MAG: NAD(P)-dependent oxidoreductase [Dehalococcoidia bacterium]
MKVVFAHAGGAPEEYGPLYEAGYEVVFGRPYGQREGGISEAEVISLCENAQCLVWTDISRGLLESLPGVHTVISNAIGYDRIDVQAATEHGVMVCNSPSVENALGVAEAVIGLMLVMGKGLKRKERQVRADGWGPRSDRGYLFRGKTVGIVGLGRIGSFVAKRLAGWEVRLLAYAPSASPEYARELGVTLVDLPELCRESDYVSLHMNAKPENLRMIGDAQIRLMKPGAYLINMARGAVLDAQAVCTAIEEDRLAGVALDVFETEPLPMDNPLRTLDPERVILTPHTLGTSVESRVGALRAVTGNVLSAMRGEVPPTVVNPEVIPRWRAKVQPS